MASPREACLQAYPPTNDLLYVDPHSNTAMEIDVPVSQRARPALLTFESSSSFFSDPWGKERPLTPLDQNVPQWFQRRKLALVPGDLSPCAESVSATTPDAIMDACQQENVPVISYTKKTLKRARSDFDMADMFSKNAALHEQISSCGQVVDEFIRSPAVQTLFSKKRKVDSSEFGMDDMLASWQRKAYMNEHWNHGNSFGRDVGLTAADFCSWNFGFDVQMAMGRC